MGHLQRLGREPLGQGASEGNVELLDLLAGQRCADARARADAASPTLVRVRNRHVEGEGLDVSETRRSDIG